MYGSVDDLKAFYNTKVGRIVRRLLLRRIRAIWPDTKGQCIAGFGYAVPYLRSFTQDKPERIISIMPAGQGAHVWPQEQGDKNLVCLCEESEIPLESNSLDRIIMVHAIEFSELLPPHLDEIWRVLKSSGRLLIVVPNRAGLWAHADWSPLGGGTPYSARQMIHALKSANFVHEQTEEALFMPPFRLPFFLKSADVYENIGRQYLPIVAGVHIVEASKQLYAKADRDSGSKIRVRGRAAVST